MKTIAAFAVVFLVALVSVNEVKPFGDGNTEGDLEEVAARPPCRRCPRPSRREKVCAFNGLQNRTFSSECLMRWKECVTGRNFMIVAKGRCLRRPASQFAQGGQGDDSSSSSEEDVSNETGGGVESTSAAPATTPTTTPSQTPTTQPTISVSGTVSTSLPVDSGSPEPTVSGAPAQTSGTGTTPASAGSTAKQCNSLDSCPPSSSVCGTDGVTYSSQCVLEVTACVNGLDTLTVAYAGVCAP